jgi:hypothetical protein
LKSSSKSFIQKATPEQLAAAAAATMTSTPSCTLGDFFGARSCGAQLSGMTMASKGNKSADATTPLRRTARDPWRVIQSGSNWHAIPVRAPLTNTEMKKMNIATEKTVTFKFYEFFSVKSRGTCRWTSFGKKRQALGGAGISERPASILLAVTSVLNKFGKNAKDPCFIFLLAVRGL